MTLRWTPEEYADFQKRNHSVDANKKAPAKKRGPSKGETLFCHQLEVAGLTGWVREHRFCDRRWRFDFAHQEKKIAVEVEGVTTYGNHLGRHQTAKGVGADCEKYNTATLMGWKVYRFTPDMVKDQTAIALILEVLKNA